MVTVDVCFAPSKTFKWVSDLPWAVALLRIYALLFDGSPDILMLPVAEAKRGSGSGIAVLPMPLVSVVLPSSILVLLAFSAAYGICGGS